MVSNASVRVMSGWRISFIAVTVAWFTLNLFVLLELYLSDKRVSFVKALLNSELHSRRLSKILKHTKLLILVVDRRNQPDRPEVISGLSNTILVENESNWTFLPAPSSRPSSWSQTQDNLQSSERSKVRLVLTSSKKHHGKILNYSKE